MRQPVRSAPLIFAPTRVNMLRPALRRFAPRRFALLRLVPTRYAPLRFATLRFVLPRFAQKRFASKRSAPLRSAPLRSGLIECSSLLQAFHASTPCRSIFRWSLFIQAFLFNIGRALSKLSSSHWPVAAYSARRLPSDRYHGLPPGLGKH